MSNPQLAKLDNDELISRFSIAAKQMGVAVGSHNTRKANRIFQTMWDIDLVLRSRGREARMALGSLLDSDDRFVRYYAAKKLLGLIPERARSVIEWNYKYGFDPIAGDAGMLLAALDSGQFKPS